MAPRNKTTNPTDTRLAGIMEAISDAEASLRRLRTEYEAEKNRITYEEPSYQAAVIKFHMQHLEEGRPVAGDTIYSYAAIKVNNRWFTTGSTCPQPGYTWGELWRFIARNRLISYAVMSEQAVPL